MPKISAALIMRNEEDNLPRLLKSLVGKFDEIVVVDTGSTDHSVEIAKNYGCKVYEKEWNGFSDARNYAISKCSGEWIWHFDADFELEEKEFEKFRKVVDFIDNEQVVSLFVKVKNYGQDGNVKGVSSQAFIHKKREDIFWNGNVHEELVTPYPAFDFNIYVNHYGYQKSNVLKEKALRNLQLIYKDLEIYNKKDNKRYLMKLFYLFQTIEILSEFDSSYLDDIESYIEEFKKIEIANDDSLSFFKYYGYVYLSSLMVKKRKLEEAEEFIRKVLQSKPIFPDIFIVEAKYWKERREKKRECESYLNFLEYVELYEQSNFVIDGKMVIIDFYHQIDSVILHLADVAKEISWLRDQVEKKWKKKRLKYFVLILLEMYDQLQKKEEFEKLAEKLEKKFERDNKVLQFLTWKYFKKNRQKSFKIAKKLYEINPQNLVANKVLAYEAIGAKDCEKAIRHLMHIVMVNADMSAMAQLIDVLKECGYTEEAEKLNKKIVELS